MSRNIQFRCWNVEEKIMHTIAFPSWNGTIDVWKDNKPQSVVQYLSMNGDEDEGVLLEYTGLKDKEGVEIYEGDILSLNYGIPPTLAIMSVSFYEGCWMVKCVNAKPEESPLHDLYMDDISVIGNIYQNPELI